MLSLSLSIFLISNENVDLTKKKGKEKFQVANKNGAQQLRATTNKVTFSDLEKSRKEEAREGKGDRSRLMKGERMDRARGWWSFVVR
jgi:hypothetical protein